MKILKDYRRKNVKIDMLNIKKLPIITLVLILIIYGFAASSIISRGHEWGDDFASYIMQAKSIVTGKVNIFYEQNSITINNSSDAIGPVAYPWGYPLILSPFYAFFGLNPLALKIPNILFFILFLIVLFLLIKKRLSPWEGILIVSILAFSPRLLSFQDNILSDIPFLLFSTLSVFLIDRFLCENKNIPLSPANNLILGISIFISTFVRSVGIILLITLFGCQMIEIFQQRKMIIERPKVLFHYLIPYLLFGFLLFITSAILPSDKSTYLSLFSSSFSNFIRDFKDNLSYYYHLMEYFLNVLPSVTVIYGFLLAFLLIGIIGRIEKDYAFIIYSTLMIGLLLIYPGKDGLRLFIPIIPFFVYFSFQGMKIGFSSMKGLNQKAGSAICYLFWVILLVAFGANSIALIRLNMAADRQVNGPFDKYSTEMFTFIKANTSSNSIIIFYKPRAMHLMTDRNSIKIIACNRLILGDFIVINRHVFSGDQISIDKLGSCGLNITQIFENDNFLVYKIENQPAEGSDNLYKYYSTNNIFVGEVQKQRNGYLLAKPD